MKIKTATALAVANTEAEQACRAAVAAMSRARQALQDCASDPAINKAGKYNIDTASFRLNIAESALLVEQAHEKLCNNHLGFNDMAKFMGIDYSDAAAGTVTTKDGGGR